MIVREFSKLHQEVIRGSVAERITAPLRGEVTIVLVGLEIAEAESGGDPHAEGARAALAVLLDPGLKPRARAKALAELTGLDAREIYERLVGTRE